MWITLSVLFAVAASVAVALAFAPRDELVTEIELQASPERVWAVLADGARYGEWNPFIRSMRGALVEGGRLENVLQPTGGTTPMTFRPTLLKVAPGRELRWLGRLLVPRLFDGEHYFLLEPRGGGTHLVHGERFRGVAFWFVAADRFRPDFDAMNHALARRLAEDR